jgi:hypothetical protein
MMLCGLQFLLKFLLGRVLGLMSGQRCSEHRQPLVRLDRSGLLAGGCLALLRMNGFEHVAHLANPGRRHVAEDIPIKMHHVSERWPANDF